MSTITLDVRVYANLREFTGFKDTKVEVPVGISIRELFPLVSKLSHNPEGFLDGVFEPDTKKVKQYFKVIINGKILMPDDILDTTVEKNNTIVAIFPPVGGG